MRSLGILFLFPATAFAAALPRLTTVSQAPGLSPAIDATDIARGYRFERSTVKGRISYEMPEGASPAGTWHLTVPTTTSCP